MPNVDEMWIQNSGIRTSLVNIHHLKTLDSATKANTLMSPHREGKQRRVSQCSRRVSVGSVTMGAAKCEMRSSLRQTIIELSYRIVIVIILIYRIVYRSKTVFDIS